MKRLLFVCTGNTCRSPMAEGLFRLVAARRGIMAEAQSAGVHAVNGMPISGHAADILQDKGAECPMASQELTAELTEWADLILTMTTDHKKQVIQQFPETVGKTFTLMEFAAADSEQSRIVEERERLVSELQIKHALQQPITDEEKEQLLKLEEMMPEFDIIDPFGGRFEAYRFCAEAIEAAIELAADKLEEREQ